MPPSVSEEAQALQEKLGPDYEVTVEETEPSEPDTVEQAFEAAQKEVSGTSEKEPEKSTPPPEKTQAEQEPEHVRWAKSVTGNWDGEKGEFVLDRVLKQAHELNRQNQSVAQQVATVRNILADPEIYALVSRKLAGTPTAKTTDGAGPERSDEEILADFVEQRISKSVEPLVRRQNLVYQNLVDSQVQLTYQRLKEEFPDYDEFSTEVGNLFAKTSQEAGIALPQMIEYLVDSGKLYETFRSAARNVAFDRLKAKLTEKDQAAEVLKGQTLEQKKRAQLTKSKGTPSREVQPVKGKVNDFWDAVKEAKKELEIE